jgi:ubiquinone/menaquinone biosynthesis C-methylase UbiE
MIILYYILIFILFLVIFSSLLFLLSPLFSLIPFVPVRKKILNEIISALELNQQSILYDLGCGDGRILFAATKANPHISCIGIEIALFPFLLAKIKKLFYNSRHVHILYGNFFKIDISSASHVFLYLFPEALDNLLSKFEKELKAGSRVVSCDFEFSKRKPDKIIEIKSTKWQKNKKLYVYDF